MTRISMILLGVLGVQLAIAVALTYGGGGNSAYQSGEPLLTFDKQAVDSIAINESGGSSVELARKDGKWVIPTMADFPASKTQTTEFLDKLAGLKKGWPVATTSDAAERFKLTEDKHERRVILKAGNNEVARLMIGTAPTFRKAHVRLANENEIYNVKLATYDAGTSGEQWMDRDYLNVDTGKITSIKLGDLQITKKDGALTVADLKDGDEVKKAELSSFIHTVANPPFDAVQGKGKDALAKVQPADFTVEVGLKDGDPVTYTFKKEGDGKAYLFASSAHPFVFRVAEARVKTIAEASRDKLVVAKVEKKPEAKETGSKPEATAPVAQPRPDTAPTAAPGG